MKAQGLGLSLVTGGGWEQSIRLGRGRSVKGERGRRRLGTHVGVEVGVWKGKLGLMGRGGRLRSDLAPLT